MTPEWQSFEQRVADAFRSLGATVEHNVQVDGQQIDVLVRDQTAAGVEVRLAVECKAYRRPVGVDDVNDFAAVLDALRALKTVVGGVLVSDSGFSRQARAAAGKRHVELREFADLVSRPDVDLTLASSEVGAAVAHADRLQANVRDALGSADPLSAFDWQDVHAELDKALAGIRGAGQVHRRTQAGAPLDRRVRTAVLRIEEAAERCLDAVWYLRMIVRMGEDADGAVAADADRTSAGLARLREHDQARGQLRARLRRLDEACSRAAGTA